MLAKNSKNFPSNSVLVLVAAERVREEAGRLKGLRRTMNTMKTTVWIALALGALTFAAACGDSNGDDGSSSGGGNGSTESTSSSSNSSFECCLNGKGYTCPDQKAFDACGGSGDDVNQCMAECQGDPTCIDGCGDLGSGDPDPSGCDADDSIDCSSDEDCAGTGIPCDLDQDCCEGLTCGPRDDGQEGGSCQ